MYGPGIKNSHIDQWGKKNNGEPRSKLTHAKELRNLNEEKIISSINSTGKTGYSQEK